MPQWKKTVVFLLAAAILLAYLAGGFFIFRSMFSCDSLESDPDPKAFMPRSYEECLSQTGIKEDGNQYGYYCPWRVEDNNKILFNKCLDAGGYLEHGLIGQGRVGCSKKTDMCEIMYYKRDFMVPRTFEECLKTRPDMVIATNSANGLSSCSVSIYMWGYNRNQMKSLYDECDRLGREQITDYILSDARGNICSLTFLQGNVYSETYRLATYSASSSAFINNGLLAIHNKELSRFKPGVLSPTPTLAVPLPKAIDGCVKTGGRWNSGSCDCTHATDSATGCAMDDSSFPAVDIDGLSRNPVPPVNGQNGLEELIFRDDFASCGYKGRVNNICTQCRQDSDCGQSYKSDWNHWVRSLYGPSCVNGRCTYRRVIFRTELDHDGKLY